MTWRNESVDGRKEYASRWGYSEREGAGGRRGGDGGRGGCGATSGPWRALGAEDWAMCWHSAKYVLAAPHREFSAQIPSRRKRRFSANGRWGRTRGNVSSRRGVARVEE